MPDTPMLRVQQIVTGVAGTPYYITGYFDEGGGSPQDAADDWAFAVRPIATGGLRTPLVYQPITSVDRVDPVTGNALGALTVSVAGLTCTSVADPLPSQNQLIMTWRTGVYVNGREIRGRTNIGGFTEDANTGGTITPATRTAWNSQGSSVAASPQSVLVVYSPTNGSWEPVNTCTVSPEWGVLRSRR